MKNQNAITLIALIITIIVLLILAGVTIGLLVGDNSVINKAQKAKTNSEISEYIDKIELSRGAVAIDQLGIATLDELINQIYEDEIVPVGNIYEVDEETAIMKTKEGYLIEIKADSVKYLGEETEVNIPNTSEIYAVLKDNTLMFFNSEESAKERVKDGGTYYEGSVKSKVFKLLGSLGNRSTDTPWYADRDSIQKVSFEEKIYPSNLDNYFNGLTNLTTIEKIENLRTINTTSMNDLFFNCTNLTDLDLSKFNTSRVTEMYALFYNCKKLTKLDLSNFNTSNVVTMDSMFQDCNNLTNLEVSSFDTSNVTNMAYMFERCNNLTELDLSSFDTSKVTQMYNMFNSCGKLTKLDLSNFDTSNVKRMSWMFRNCSNLTNLDLSNFDTSNVTGMYEMFKNCSNLTELDLSSFDTSNVYDFACMFKGCTELKELYCNNFTIKNTAYIGDMFNSLKKLEKLNISKFDLENHTGEEGWAFYLIPKNAEITTTKKMKIWFEESESANRCGYAFTNIVTID